MPSPRRHIPGQIAMLTRRIVDRRFFLRPDRNINRTFEWELAKASTTYGVPVHAVMVMMNHHHVVASDPDARRSDFMRDFASGVARSRNAYLDRAGALWDNRPYGDTVLLDRDAVERKILYTLLNPVQAGLVRRAEQWPGFKILPRDWGRPRTVQKPTGGHYKQAPQTITYTPMPPAPFADEPLDDVIAYFEMRLREEEDRIAAKRRAIGRGFRHPRALRRVDPSSKPRTRAPMGGISPRFATTNLDLMLRAKRLWQSFLRAYRGCRRAWRRGERDIVFPAGTLQYRVEHRVRCRSPDANEPTVID